MGNTGSSSHKIILYGCLLPLVIAILIIGVIFIYITSPTNVKPPIYITKVDKKIQLKIKDLNVGLKKNKDYDLDQTVTALFSIEKALKESKDFETLTEYIMQKNSDRIALDVVKLKYNFFNVYKKLLEDQDDLDELKSIYNIVTGAFTDVSGMVGFDLAKGISFDKAQAKQVWAKRLEDSKTESKIKERLRSEKDQILELLFEYAKLHEKYLKEWNKLCAMRDRAYLALYEGDWNEVIDSTSAAIALAPYEKEAHILLAMGLIERKKEIDMPKALEIVNQYLKNHPGSQAPGYLLRGVIYYNEKKYDNAALDFDQAAAYYPKQQEEINEKLNLYKKRQFLNKSKEGRMIVNMYRGIMSGSGYFSPDFQKARIHVNQKMKEKAKKKIFDHFFRRRLQGEWDQVLMDFYFCKKYIKSDFDEIFNGENLSIEIEPAWLTNSLIVSIKNHSNKNIHNLTLLLCVRFTDMFIGDYVTFPVGKSIAVIRPGETVQVGRQNINDLTKKKIGTIKEWNDIIEYGAILISDELIAWVTPTTRERTTKETPVSKKSRSSLELLGKENRIPNDEGKRKNKNNKKDDSAFDVIN